MIAGFVIACWLYCVLVDLVIDFVLFFIYFFFLSRLVEVLVIVLPVLASSCMSGNWRSYSRSRNSVSRKVV